jgi:hypothetical protein
LCLIRQYPAVPHPPEALERAMTITVIEVQELVVGDAGASTCGSCSILAM